MLLALLVALGAASVPGALRAARLDEPPRLTVRPFRVAVNRASPDELSALPGVGPSLASRMADERARAPFRAADDLRRVTGIGPSLVSRIGPHADFDAEPRGR